MTRQQIYVLAQRKVTDFAAYLIATNNSTDITNIVQLAFILRCQ